MAKEKTATTKQKTAAAPATPVSVPVVAKSTALAAPVEMPADWGSEGLSSNDILIGKALLMQGQSQFVQDGKAGVGEIRNNLTEELIAKKGEAFQFIPFSSARVWIISKKPVSAPDNAKWEFVESYPITPENENQEWEAVEGQDKIRRDKVIQLFCLNPKKLDDIPLLIAFRRTNYRAGRKLTSSIMQLKSIKKVPANRIFEITSEQQEREGNKYFILNARMTDTETTPEQLAKAYEWYKTLQAGLIKISEKGDDDASDGAAPPDGSASAKASDSSKDHVEY